MSEQIILILLWPEIVWRLVDIKEIKKLRWVSPNAELKLGWDAGGHDWYIQTK